MNRELRHAIEVVGAAEAPAGVRTRIVAIDGLGGAGKTTLAEQLASALAAVVVHTDDFASWANPIDWWPALLAAVLEPLAAGDSAVFTPTSWDGAEPQPVRVEPGGIVLLEGVSASREAFGPYLACSLWVETPSETRLARGLQRDGEPMREQWERWMAAEDDYADSERPRERADLVLRGDRDLWR